MTGKPGGALSSRLRARPRPGPTLTLNAKFPGPDAAPLCARHRRRAGPGG